MGWVVGGGCSTTIVWTKDIVYWHASVAIQVRVNVARPVAAHDPSALASSAASLRRKHGKSTTAGEGKRAEVCEEEKVAADGGARRR